MRATALQRIGVPVPRQAMACPTFAHPRKVTTAPALPLPPSGFRPPHAKLHLRRNGVLNSRHLAPDVQPEPCRVPSSSPEVWRGACTVPSSSPAVWADVGTVQTTPPDVRDRSCRMPSISPDVWANACTVQNASPDVWRSACTVQSASPDVWGRACTWFFDHFLPTKAPRKPTMAISRRFDPLQPFYRAHGRLRTVGRARSPLATCRSPLRAANAGRPAPSRSRVRPSGLGVGRRSGPRMTFAAGTGVPRPTSFPGAGGDGNFVRRDRVPLSALRVPLSAFRSTLNPP